MRLAFVGVLVRSGCVSQRWCVLARTDCTGKNVVNELAAGAATIAGLAMKLQRRTPHQRARPAALSGTNLAHQDHGLRGFSAEIDLDNASRWPTAWGPRQRTANDGRWGFHRRAALPAGELLDANWLPSPKLLGRYSGKRRFAVVARSRFRRFAASVVKGADA